jgi:hypothetical protein
VGVGAVGTLTVRAPYRPPTASHSLVSRCRAVFGSRRAPMTPIIEAAVRYTAGARRRETRVATLAGLSLDKMNTSITC